MPRFYTIHQALRVIVLRPRGRVSHADLVADRAALGDDPRFNPVFSQLIDLSGVDRESLNVLRRCDIEEFARISRFAPGVRRAIIAPGDLEYGLARMFEALACRLRQDIHVFRDLLEACAWLDVPLSLVREPALASETP